MELWAFFSAFLALSPSLRAQGPSGPPAAVAPAVAPAAATVSAPSLNVELESRFLWLDALARPRHLQEQNPRAVPLTAVSVAPRGQGPRSLGLEYLRSGLHWRVGELSRFSLSLRPDATLPRGVEGTSGQAVDTRAGESYRALSPLSFLDSYELRLGPADQGASVALGVFEQLGGEALVYKPLLGFGLQVKLPEKTSGVRLTWAQRSPPALALLDKAVAQGERAGQDWEAFVFQGRDDRSEQLGFKPASFDSAPVAADPYGGMALAYRCHACLGGLTANLELTLGYGQAVFVRQGQVPPARVQETFAEALLSQKLNLGVRRLSLAANLRFSRESWQKDSPSLPALLQLSASGSGRLELVPQQAALFALQWGHSERPSLNEGQNKRLYSGYQAELGWAYELVPGAQVQIFASEEQRSTRDAQGQPSGGFRHLDSAQKMLRRLGLAIDYQVTQGW